MATRADRCSYIPSVDTPFVSRKGREEYLPGVGLFSESESHLLVRLAMGTNVKITESRENALTLRELTGDHGKHRECLTGKLIQQQ